MFKCVRVMTDKLPGESKLDYNRFIEFRNSDRNYVNFAKSIGISTSRLYAISTANKWSERLVEFDKKNSEEFEKNHLAIINEIKESKLELYFLLRTKLIEKLKSISSKDVPINLLSKLLSNLDALEDKLLDKDKIDENDKSTELLRSLIGALNK